MGSLSSKIFQKLDSCSSLIWAAHLLNFQAQTLTWRISKILWSHLGSKGSSFLWKQGSPSIFSPLTLGSDCLNPSFLQEHPANPRKKRRNPMKKQNPILSLHLLGPFLADHFHLQRKISRFVCQLKVRSPSHSQKAMFLWKYCEIEHRAGCLPFKSNCSMWNFNDRWFLSGCSSLWTSKQVRRPTVQCDQREWLFI